MMHGHVEGVLAEIVEIGSVKSGLRFEPDQEGIGKLRVEADDQGGGMEIVRDWRVPAEAEGIVFHLHTQAQNSDLRASASG